MNTVVLNSREELERLTGWVFTDISEDVFNEIDVFVKIGFDCHYVDTLDSGFRYEEKSVDEIKQIIVNENVYALINDASETVVIFVDVNRTTDGLSSKDLDSLYAKWAEDHHNHSLMPANHVKYQLI